MTNRMQVDVVEGSRALALVDDARFIELWRDLSAACRCATAFQQPAFVSSWYHAYRDRWTPVLVRATEQGGGLLGLWLLARKRDSQVLAHAGAHQAEYQIWLARPGIESAFLSAAWRALKDGFAFPALSFNYLPRAALAELLLGVPSMAGCVAIRLHSRPLLKLDAAEVRASLAKKSNRSRFNRLKRLGSLSFHRLRDPVDLQRFIDDLCAFYDLRQCALGHSTPFLDDPCKRDFHVRLFDAAQEDLYVTVTLVDDKPIAAFWGMTRDDVVHLGMLMHSPMFAEHSPGKLHLMQLSEALLADGKHVIDLTPGGDLWKERFANAHDEVAQAVVYRSRARLAWARAAERTLQHLKLFASRVGITPLRVRSFGAAMRERLRGNSLRPLRAGDSASEVRIYRAERARVGACAEDARVRCNALADLLAFRPSRHDGDRQAFLSHVLRYLEAGSLSYSVRDADSLALCGWLTLDKTELLMAEVGHALALPPGSCALHSFHRSATKVGIELFPVLVAHMLRAAFERTSIGDAYLFVPATDEQMREAVERMGLTPAEFGFTRPAPRSEISGADSAASPNETTDA